MLTFWNLFEATFAVIFGIGIVMVFYTVCALLIAVMERLVRNVEKDLDDQEEPIIQDPRQYQGATLEYDPIGRSRSGE